MKPKTKKARGEHVIQPPGKLTMRMLSETADRALTVLIEGDKDTLEWFGKRIVRHARLSVHQGCDIHAGPKEAGSAWFSKSSDVGFYVHRLPCSNEIYGPGGVVNRTHALFGERKASRWLRTPLAILGNRSPNDVLEIKGGIKKIERILTRIEHGIPS